MHKELQRIAIAEACGWKLGINDGQSNWHPDDGLWSRRNNEFEGVPDYLSDLNAMHEAEKVIEDDFKKFEEYGRNLIRIVLETKTDGVPATYSGVVCIARATATQRAEAFLRTLGLWKEAA